MTLFLNGCLALVMGVNLFNYLETGKNYYLAMAAAFALWCVLNAIERRES